MKQLPDNSVDLIVNDPPYNINKNSKWDKFKSEEYYLEWCLKWILECNRVLKDNGSLYFFHNQFPVICDLQNTIKKNKIY